MSGSQLFRVCNPKPTKSGFVIRIVKAVLNGKQVDYKFAFIILSDYKSERAGGSINFILWQ
ncbi:hypothetical protein [uncultured Pontibacter sp.]|uniref:hypothetical protein n=1 Tax=uncultured Pontibacter sp. TaxID=453356 RepID=UPI002638A2BD|nr:hypothetical protein [uncultured Pontibacter sp.]